MLITQRVSLPQFEELMVPLVGLEVTHPWRGYGSALFLELGPLKRVRRLRRPGHSLKGLASFMIEWDWRVELRRSIAFGSGSSDRKINSGIRQFRRLQVEAISISARLPELHINLSNRFWIRSFSTVESQPAWTLFLPDESWIRVGRGVLVREWSTQPRGPRGMTGASR